MRKVANQKDNEEFYSLVKEVALFKPAQIAETAESKQRTRTGTQEGENAHRPLLKGDGRARSGTMCTRMQMTPPS